MGPRTIPLPAFAASVKTVTFQLKCGVGKFKLVSGGQFFGGDCGPGVTAGGGFQVAKMNRTQAVLTVAPSAAWSLVVWAS